MIRRPFPDLHSHSQIPCTRIHDLESGTCRGRINDRCSCKPVVKFLNAYSYYGYAKPMTNAQREWCIEVRQHYQKIDPELPQLSEEKLQSFSSSWLAAAVLIAFADLTLIDREGSSNVQ